MRIHELMEEALRRYQETAAEHERNPSERTLLRRVCAASQAWGAACAVAALLERDAVDGHVILARYGAQGRQVSELVSRVVDPYEIVGVVISES